MIQYKTVFKNLLDLLPRKKFDEFIGQHNADKYTKNFSCWNQLTTLLYAQITRKDSLREIETGLRCQQRAWNYIGLEGISKSNLAYANENRPFEIFKDLFYAILGQCRYLLPDNTSFRFRNDLYALDSTTIDLCLSLFSWAKFRTQKGGFKLHTLLDVKTQIPEMIVDSPAEKNDIGFSKTIDWNLPKYTILVMDKAYVDYKWLYDFHKNECFFVCRLKKNAVYKVLGQLNSRLIKGVISDEYIEFTSNTGKGYPEKVRKVTYYDEIHKITYEFFTNNFTLSPKTIADIYKSRWQIEIFFKWIKQHLKVKTFLGTSKNAVMTQIWIAMIYYLLLSYIKFQTKFKKSILELSRILEETLLSHLTLIDILNITKYNAFKTKIIDDPPQLSLF